MKKADKEQESCQSAGSQAGPLFLLAKRSGAEWSGVERSQAEPSGVEWSQAELSLVSVAFPCQLTRAKQPPSVMAPERRKLAPLLDRLDQQVKLTARPSGCMPVFDALLLDELLTRLRGWR